MSQFMWTLEMVDVCVLASMWYAQKNIYGR